MEVLLIFREGKEATLARGQSIKNQFYAMTKPKKATAPPSTLSSYLLTAVKVLLVVVIILLLPKLVTGAPKPGGRRNKKLMQQFESMRFDCEHSTCKEFLPEESSMCVSRCISAACHEEIYGENPLEDGEINVPRAREFEKCVKEQLRAERAQQARTQRS